MNQSGKFTFKGKIKVVDIIDNEDGSARVIFEADRDFKKSFKKFYGLKRWSQRRFDLFLQEAIKHSYNLLMEQQNGEKTKKEENKH